MNDSVEAHQALLDSGAKIVKLRVELHKLTGGDKEKEFDDFTTTQVERERELFDRPAFSITHTWNSVDRCR